MKKIKTLIILLVGSLLFVSLAKAETTVTYYVNDALGSPVAAMDEAGALKWRKHYKPFGEEFDAADAVGEKIGYTGHVHDDSTGLTYMQARYYDPIVGRFMGIDPIGFDESNPLSFNRYAYANNNPYRFVDPDGREALPGVSRDMAVVLGRDMTKYDASHKEFQELTQNAMSLVPIGGAGVLAIKYADKVADIAGLIIALSGSPHPEHIQQGGAPNDGKLNPQAAVEKVKHNIANKPKSKSAAISKLLGLASVAVTTLFATPEPVQAEPSSEVVK